MYAIFLCHYDVTRWWNKGSLMATAQVAFVLMCLSFPERSRKKFLNVQSLRSVFCILQRERWKFGAMDFFSKTKVLSLLLFALSTMILFSSTSARHLRKEHKIIRHGTKKKQNCNNTTKDHKVRCRDKLKLCKKQAELHNVKLGTIVAGSRPGRLHAKHEKTRGGINKKYSNNFTTKDRETKCHQERTKCEMQAKVAKGKSFYSFLLSKLLNKSRWGKGLENVKIVSIFGAFRERNKLCTFSKSKKLPYERWWRKAG